MTVDAMRAAIIALRAGVFEGANEADVLRGPRTPRVELQHGAHRPGDRLPWTDAAGGSVILVLAGHAGAGASTVALAVAEELAASRRVQLLEYAEPARSGLAAAPMIELGMEGPWWRRGRRGRLDVYRLARRPADSELPSPPEMDDAERLLVVDVGWSLTTALLDAPSSIARGAEVVVVTRVTVPAVRQTEQLLAGIGGEPVVATVGSARWPRAVEASCGPRLTELRSRGRVVRVPVDRRLEPAGLTGDRLPKPVAAAGQSLAALLVPPGAPQPGHRRRRAPSRTGPAGPTR
jgi:hypothetical protein